MRSVWLFFLMGYLLVAAKASGDSTGTLSPVSVVEESLADGFSGGSWVNPASVLVPDDVYAGGYFDDYDIGGHGTTNLVCTFDLSAIPSGSVVTGMEVYVEGWGGFADNYVHAHWGDTNARKNLTFENSPIDSGIGGLDFDTMFGNPGVVYGSPADNWGGLSLADLTAPDAALAIIIHGMFDDSVSLDHVTLEVHYISASDLSAGSWFSVAVLGAIVAALGRCMLIRQKRILPV